jgi:hypothetical protein
MRLSFSAAGTMSASSFTSMVLNLMQVKILPWRIFLFWKKNTGPLELSLMMTARTGVSQERIKTMANREMRMSALRFSTLIKGLFTG